MTTRQNDSRAPDGRATLAMPNQRPQERLILVSNRGPAEHCASANGRMEQQCNAGGVATVLEALAPRWPVTWIASAADPADHLLAADGATIPLGNERRLRLVAPPREAYDLFYGTFCNPILWFVQHAMTDRLDARDIDSDAVDAWQRGYVPVNQSFAEAVIDELDSRPGRALVMLHDYHLYAAPLFIRNRRPDARLQHFVHIPWPEPATWRVLREPIVQSICEGLLANDSVVFQTEAYARNFVETCRAYLQDVAVDAGGGLLSHAGQTTRVWANPVSVDIWELRRELSSPEAERYREKLLAPDGMRTIVRVDRLDPSKNAAAGFRAFGRLLERHPEWVGKARFLAFLVPSRSAIPEYQRYAKEVFAAADEVNARFGTPDWTPICAFHEHNRLQALVAMSMYDVLLVNPVLDGMNLVAKEGPAVNTKNGVLVLSETAGSHDELRAGALSLRPNDIEGTAVALDRALRMPVEERRERMQRLREAIIRHDLRRWFRLLLEDLEHTPVTSLPAGAPSLSAYGPR